MGRRIEVPITPSVLKWAIAESGYTEPEVSSWIEGGEATLTSWFNETAKPSLSEMKTIAGKLHRQLATFLLPVAPVSAAVPVKFRHPLGGHQRPLNPIERRFVRRARRLQEAHVWLLGELAQPTPDIPRVSLSASSDDAARSMRSLLGISLAQQFEWRSASAAFDAWREAIERLGIIVVLFPMGNVSCRGFSIWSDAAPLIAVNTAWKDEARIFTLFHELGHLVTRTDSACATGDAATGGPDEPAERWSETFAAAIVIPHESVGRLPGVTDLRQLGRLANQYKVSLRAMAIRLIGAGKANWGLYRSIPSTADNKPKGGPVGAGRNRRAIREDEFGHRGTSVFVEAVRREVITPSQALDYLDIPVAEFAQLEPVEFPSR
ncbi:MAG: ImmA/IrrE family metallo-endopeptidase [Acidobacteriota bacterium]|nr:ImmA/IrrE family metallo-endopeptidase [Acidobacteriota bacterium]